MAKFQGELAIDTTAGTSSDFSGSATLRLTSSGDVSLVFGRDKLVTQLLRTIMNDRVAYDGMSLNSTKANKRVLSALLTSVLRGFRSDQITQTTRIDPDILGYGLYVYGVSGTSIKFIPITDNPIESKFTLNNLENGKSYIFGITHKYRRTETSLLEKIVVTPTAYRSKQNPSIGNYITAFPSNRSITFFVDGVRDFYKAELLEEILNIDVYEDTVDPRRYTADLTVMSLDENSVSFSSKRGNI